MAHIQPVLYNLKGQTYEQVDRRIHQLVGIPDDKEFYKLSNKPFRGTIPKDKTMKVYEVILYSEQQYNPNATMDDVMSKHKHFRLENSFGNMFRTGKTLHGSRYQNTVIFDVSAYDDSTHMNHLNLFKRLAEAFEYDNNAIEIYSIEKDRHDNARDRCRPFARDSIALLIIRLDNQI
jgi:hypothetical protein